MCSPFSDGSYGIPKGLVYSIPCLCPGDGKFAEVKNLKVDEYSKKMMSATAKELVEERDMVRHLL